MDHVLLYLLNSDGFLYRNTLKKGNTLCFPSIRCQTIYLFHLWYVCWFLLILDVYSLHFMHFIFYYIIKCWSSWSEFWYVIYLTVYLIIIISTSTYYDEVGPIGTYSIYAILLLACFQSLRILDPIRLWLRITSILKWGN